MRRAPPRETREGAPPLSPFRRSLLDRPRTRTRRLSFGPRPLPANSSPKFGRRRSHRSAPSGSNAEWSLPKPSRSTRPRREAAARARSRRCAAPPS
eukprot:4485942-Prymnesium_polylepis.3